MVIRDTNLAEEHKIVEHASEIMSEIGAGA